MSPKDTHRYPLKSLSLLSRDLSDKPQQIQKVHYLISKSRDMRDEASTKTDIWLIYDVMALIQSLSVKNRLYLYLERTSAQISRGGSTSIIFALQHKSLHHIDNRTNEMIQRSIVTLTVEEGWSYQGGIFPQIFKLEGVQNKHCGNLEI